jgi:hypothetical protein
MPMEPQFLALLTQTLTIEPFVGEDRYSKKTYGPAFTCPAWINPMPRRTTDKIQDTAWQITQAIVPDDVTITMQDRITMPDGSQPPLLEIAEGYDNNGLHHYELMFGYARKGVGY